MRPAESARLLSNIFLIMPGLKARTLPAPAKGPYMKGFSYKTNARDTLQNARQGVKYFSRDDEAKKGQRQLKLNRLKLTTMRLGFNAQGKMHGMNGQGRTHDRPARAQPLKSFHISTCIFVWQKSVHAAEGAVPAANRVVLI